uniref:Uncharacterized protein n=2 Tax=Canis lupus familiaris TaxID=9615 RepID=A0A8C0SYL3_CANLF
MLSHNSSNLFTEPQKEKVLTTWASKKNRCSGVFRVLRQGLLAHFITARLFSQSLFCFLMWMTTLDFPVALLQTFKLGPTLFQGPKEAILSEPLSHGPVHLAVSMTVSERLIKLSLTENCKESSGLFIAPIKYIKPQKRIFSRAG